jgi:hypothetical protein
MGRAGCPADSRRDGALRNPSRQTAQGGCAQWTFVVTSYFLLLVRPRQDDTFPAMATRPWKVFPSLTDLITGVRSDLAFILIGQGTMSHEPTAGRR